MPQFTKETARENQEKALESRRRKKKLSLEERVKMKAGKYATVIMADLIKAAKGEEEFADLDIGKRVDCMKTVLAYGIGRPSMGKAANPEPDEPDEPAEDPSLV